MTADQIANAVLWSEAERGEIKLCNDNPRAGAPTIDGAALRVLAKGYDTARQEIAALTTQVESFANTLDDYAKSVVVATERAYGAVCLHASEVPGVIGQLGTELTTLREQHRAAVAERDTYKARYIEAFKVLREIANADYRGNRSWESQRAHQALTEPPITITPTSPDTAPVGEAWRLIETAPKDYTSVLLHEPGRYTGQGCYSNHLRGWQYDSPYLGGNPTHWQPLPLPPGTPTLDPATCRAQGHGRVACERCGAELVDVASVREREA